MEFAHGILLDQKFVYRSVHAAFANTKWYDAWSERTLSVHPIIHDVQDPRVLTQVGGWPRPRPAARVLTRFFHSFPVRPVAVARRILRWSERFPLIRLSLVSVSVRIITAARRPCCLSQDTLGFIQILSRKTYEFVGFSFGP